MFGMNFQDFSYHAVCSAISLIALRFDNLSIPIKNNFYYDLIGELDGKLFKIKVVQTLYKQPSGAYKANLAKSGGYLAKKEYKEKFCKEKCDYVFVNTPDGNYLIPSFNINTFKSITLSKYSEYKVS
jgi:hypothetical protein